MNALFTSMTAQVAYDGQPAKLIELTNRRGMRVVVMDIGATWLSCTLPMGDESREVLLGVSSMDDFVRQGSYLGATVGALCQSDCAWRTQDRDTNVCFVGQSSWQYVTRWRCRV